MMSLLRRRAIMENNHTGTYMLCEKSAETVDVFIVEIEGLLWVQLRDYSLRLGVRLGG